MELAKHELCNGCMACYNSCGKNAIRIEQSKQGFYYPLINQEVCVTCGNCVRTCPVLTPPTIYQTEHVKCIGALVKDDAIRLNSSSGGIFSLLAKKYIEGGGLVCGVAMSSDKTFAEHIIVDNVDELPKLMGSKYLQSYVGGIYKEIKRYLDNGKKILFSGTPCQVDGLRNYLKKDYTNLLCVDIVCHGVPSPKLWAKYINNIKSKYGRDIETVNFRAKKISWENFGMEHKNSKDKVYFNPKQKDPYLRMFFTNLCLNESCYDCKAKGGKWTSDITLGDLWGAASLAPKLSDGKGTSLVIIHTEKGESTFNSILSFIRHESVDYERSVACNICVEQSVHMPDGREEFFENLNSKSFDWMKKRYVKRIKKGPKEQLRYLLDKLGILQFVLKIFRGVQSNNK